MPGGVPPGVARQREEIAWELRGRFWTERRIAEHLGVSPAAAHKILKRAEKKAFARMVASIEATKATQTAQLETVAIEAYEAWQRSKQAAETVKTTVGPQGEGQGQGEATLKEETTVKGQAGDPALLSQARGALADIRAIWGLDAPERHEVEATTKSYAFNPDGPDGP